MRLPTPRALDRDDLERIRIPAPLRNATPEDFDPRDPGYVAVRRVLDRYGERLHRFRRRGIGLLLWGPNGTGKSRAACSILKTVVQWGYTAYFTTEDDYRIGAATDAVYDQNILDGTVTVQERARQVDFLCLDDLGRAHRSESAYGRTVVEALLRYRVQRGLPLILTTNLSFISRGQEDPGFRDVYGDSVLDLLMEAVLPVNVTGTSRRFDAAKALRDEFEVG